MLYVSAPLLASLPAFPIPRKDTKTIDSANKSFLYQRIDSATREIRVLEILPLNLIAQTVASGVTYALDLLENGAKLPLD